MADDGGASGARPVVGGGETGADGRCHAEDLENIGARDRIKNPFRLTGRHIASAKRPRADRFERRVLVPDVGVIRKGQRPQHAGVTVALHRQQHQAIRVRERQRPQTDGIYDRKDGGVRPNPEGEDHPRHNSELGAAARARKLERRAANILIPQLYIRSDPRYCALVTMRQDNRLDVIQVKRAYDPPSQNDGVRVLVDRLWPRGLTKTAAAVDLWLKDLAPSVTLRRWFNHDPSRWAEFTERYAQELDAIGARTPAVAALAAAIRGGKVTLLFGARDTRHNNATALRSYLSRVI